MPPQNETNDSTDARSSSSWFDWWFQRDVRKDIHEQLNDFEERKKQYENEEHERRRFFQQHPHAGFPFFVPPGFDPSQQQRHKDELKDFMEGRIPKWPPAEFGQDERDQEQRRRNSSSSNSNSNSNSNSPFDKQESIEDLHREMQSLFEQAFAGGFNQGGWSSSSTVVSSFNNGTSYTLKQDSTNGARVDLQLPKNSSAANVSLEVLKEQPCLIRWKNNDDKDERKRNNNNNNNKNNDNKNNGQVLELGNAVDCSKLSASISEARRTLTVKAPPKSKEFEEPQSLQLKPNSYPRPVRLAKKD